MKIRRASQLLCTLAVSFALGTAFAAPPVASAAPPEGDAAIARLMQDWQNRIFAERLPVADPANWAKRNLVKFSDLTPAQVRLAQQATTLGELELLLLDPPVAEGARLGLVLATQLPGKITLIHTGTQAKLTPASSPAAYADLTFTALTPCRIYDSRPSQGGPGTWLAGSTNSINVGPNSSYAFQGGSATSCGMDTLIGPGRIAAVMASVSTVNQASAGYLAFFSNGATNPFPYGVTQSYQPGPVQTSFVVIPTDLVGAVLASGYSTQQTNVIIDVVGYFAPPGNIALADSTPTTGNILKDGNRFIHNYGTYNTFIGEAAGNFTMTDAYNTAFGAYSLVNNTTGNQNTASGAFTLNVNTTGYGNTASGSGALQLNTTGFYNTASGSLALYNNTTGNNNTASGAAALYSNTTGNDNTANGFYSLGSNTTGYSNTAIGDAALYNNTTGFSNTAVGGHRALYTNTTGYNNTAIGDAALNKNTTAANNTATGALALFSNTTGNNNAAFGVNALVNNTTGGGNIAIGTNAGFSLTTGNSNIVIDNFGFAGESNTIRIGTAGNQTRAFVAGIRGATTGVADGVAVLVDSSGQLGTVSSSRRFKDDIADMDAASSALMKLRPVTFHYKSDRAATERRLQYGLIAEEVAGVYPGLVAHSADGLVETVMYQFLPTMLLNEVQKQQRTIQMQAGRIDAQAGRIDTQARHLAQLERDRDLKTVAMTEQAKEIAGLKAAVAKIADLERQMSHMARLLDQQRAGAVTAGLDLK